MSGREKSIAGERFSWLVAVRRVPRPTNDVYWLFRCDCGQEKEIFKKNVLKGRTRSCGCKQVDLIKQNRVVPKKPQGHAARHLLLWSYKKGALSRGLEFSISDDEFYALTRMNCVYCNQEPDRPTGHAKYGKINGEYFFNGVDRADNTAGYTTSNSVACCKDCNMAKRNLRLEEFLKWVVRLSNNKQRIQEMINDAKKSST